jgi:hypothetical protein
MSLVQDSISPQQAADQKEGKKLKVAGAKKPEARLQRKSA